jgi:truncated hemoglobin YjbI
LHVEGVVLTPPAEDLYALAGGEAVVRPVVDAFVRRMASDFIIGFFFAGKDLEKIVQHEFEHAAAVLGADVPYRGAPIPSLHQPLRINAGHFRRRLAILVQELDRANVPPVVKEAWLDAQRRMERRITDGTDCV